MLLINLVLIGLLLTLDKNSTRFWIAVLLFSLINFVLLLWEILQAVAVGIDYIIDAWNIIDFIKILLSLAWPFLIYFDLDPYWFNWILVLVSVVRGFTSFRASNLTRYYIRLIFESLKDVSSFLLIFIYATLSYGLLNITMKDEDEYQDKSIEYILWRNSFGLGFGNGISTFSDFNLEYVTYVLAVILNVVLMLNMIISIFGDSFDKFQLLSNYYNYKEMTEVILELENIFSFLNRSSESKYIHTVINPYIKEDDVWKGRVVENKELLDNTSKEIKGIKDDINDKIASMEKKLEEILKLLQPK
jgi:fluoride ion exporter CrcB/FEX